jgi:hypothetical protein
MDQDMDLAHAPGQPSQSAQHPSLMSDFLVDDGFQEVLGRGQRKKQTERMAASVRASFEDDDGQLQRLPQPEHGRPSRIHKVPRPTRGSRFDPLSIEEASDADDVDFEARSTSEGESSSSSEDEPELLNTEVCVFSVLGHAHH